MMNYLKKEALANLPGLGRAAFVRIRDMEDHSVNTMMVIPSRLHTQLVYALNYATGLAWHAFILVAFMDKYSIDPKDVSDTGVIKLWVMAGLAALVICPLIVLFLRAKTKLAVQLQQAIAAGDYVEVERVMGTDLTVTQLLDSGLVFTLATFVYYAIDALFPARPKPWIALELAVFLVVLPVLSSAASKISWFPLSLTQEAITRMLNTNYTIVTVPWSLVKFFLFGRRPHLSSFRDTVTNIHAVIEPEAAKSIYSGHHEDINDSIISGSAFIITLTFRELNWIAFDLDKTATNTDLLDLWMYAIFLSCATAIFANLAEQWKMDIEKQMHEEALDLELKLESEFIRKVEREGASPSSNKEAEGAGPIYPSLSATASPPQKVQAPPSPPTRKPSFKDTVVGEVEKLEHRFVDIVGKTRLRVLHAKSKSIPLNMAKLVSSVTSKICVLTLYSAAFATVMSMFREKSEIYDPLPLNVIAVYTPCVLLAVVVLTSIIESLSNHTSLREKFHHLEGNINEASLAHHKVPKLVSELLKSPFSLKHNFLSALSWITGEAVHEFATTLWQVMFVNTFLAKRAFFGTRFMTAFLYAIAITLITVTLTISWGTTIRIKLHIPSSSSKP